MDLLALESHFKFGENWERLLREMDEGRVAAAMRDLDSFMGHHAIQNRSFLDVGCGSGLSSLAAYRLGAKSILSVDIDPINIRNTELIKHAFGVPDQFAWECRVGSIVDDDLVLSPADIVYSWGVLHHTGDMWKGIKRCAELVNPNGHLYLMLYRDAVCAPLWKAIKRRYNDGGRFSQWLLLNGFAAVLVAGLLLKGRNPFNVMRQYPAKNRGMSWYIDIRDWVGGYPFEYASAQQVCEALPGFVLERIDPPKSPRQLGWRGTGSHSYLFRRIA